jgi:hypothetical protein
VPGPALQASNRVLHSATPPEWLPPSIAEQLLGMRFKTAPRYLTIISDLSPGDALVDWLERGVRRPDLVLLGARESARARAHGACARRAGAAESANSHRGGAGSRGFTGLRRFLVGSVSSYVVEMEVAPCLVVRSSLPRHAACGEEGGDMAAATARDEAGPAELTAAPARGRVVGIAVDGTPAGAALVQWCRQYLLRPTDTVSVLHGRPEKPKARAAAPHPYAARATASERLRAARSPRFVVHKLTAQPTHAD